MLGLSELRQSLHGFLIGTHVVMPFFTAALFAEDCSFIPMSNAVALNSAISSPTPAANCPVENIAAGGRVMFCQNFHVREGPLRHLMGSIVSHAHPDF